LTGIILRQKWTIVFVTLFVVGITAFISFLQKNVYRSTVQVAIEKENADQYGIIKSQDLAQRVIKKLNLQEKPEFQSVNKNIISTFLDHIIVEPVKKSNRLKISFESYSPEMAAKIVNTIADEFVGIVLVHNLLVYREMLGKVSAAIAMGNYLSEDVQTLPAIANNKVIQSLKTEIAAKEDEYMHLPLQYTNDHPDKIALSGHINYLKEQLRNEIDNTLHYIQSQLSGEFKADSASIVDYAYAIYKPVRPHRRNTVLVAGVAGIVLGCVLAFFRENRSNSLAMEKVMAKIGNIAFLGSIPLNKKRHVTGNDHEKSCMAEAFVNIRTNLACALADRQLKTVLITSAQSGEGKTFAALNIALAFAKTGKKTLLIDADLRHSSLSRLMGRKRSEGVSNYFVLTTTADKLLQFTETENLAFISAGTILAGEEISLPVEKVKEFMQLVSKDFDHIIIDSTAVLSGNDTLNIAAAVDGTVLLVDSRKKSMNAFSACKTRLLGMGVHPVGLIMNAVKAHSMNSSPAAFQLHG
jgi:capsular exopolysaccharide synthesis family protein